MPDLIPKRGSIDGDRSPKEVPSLSPSEKQSLDPLEHRISDAINGWLPKEPSQLLKPQSLKERSWTHFLFVIGDKISQIFKDIYRRICGKKETFETTSLLSREILQGQQLRWIGEQSTKEEISSVPQPPDVKAVKNKAETVVHVTPPHGIPNVGNACYRLAVEQAIFACEPLLNILKKPFNEEAFNPIRNESVEEFTLRRKTARDAHALLQTLMTYLENEETSPDEIFQVETQLREVLFKAKPKSLSLASIVNGVAAGIWGMLFGANAAKPPPGILMDEFSPSLIEAQMEADKYLTLILGTLCNVQEVADLQQTTRMSTEHLAACKTEEEVQTELQRASLNGTLYTTTSAKEEVLYKGIPLGEPESHLQDLVDRTYTSVQESSIRLDQKVVTRNEKGEEVSQTITKPFTRYIEKITCVNEKPKDFLIMQIGRVVAAGEPVDRTPVTMPVDGIIDLSQAYGAAPGTVMYRATSFICHEGERADIGHYTSYVRKKGRWFHCDDSRVAPAKSEKELLKQMGQAYMMFFEKV